LPLAAAVKIVEKPELNFSPEDWLFFVSFVSSWWIF